MSLSKTHAGSVDCTIAPYVHLLVNHPGTNTHNGKKGAHLERHVQVRTFVEISSFEGDEMRLVSKVA